MSMNQTKEVRKHNVFIVDDDLVVLKAIAQSLESIGCKTHTFGSAFECLEAIKSRDCQLIISDVNMPELDGLELMRKIKGQYPNLPIVMISGYGDIPIAVQAVKDGAVDFIEKPLDEDVFLPKIENILKKIEDMPDQILTPTEHLILGHIIAGKSNKEIAYTLGRSTRTIENHRSRIMDKMGAENAADLARITLSSGLIKVSEEG